MKVKYILFTFAMTLLVNASVSAQDSSFYIFLCFGQSNMEGNAKFEPQDTLENPRFSMLQPVDCSSRGRIKDTWYGATPPLCRCNTGLTPADYFGRTMVANLPGNIRVGVINVSVAGCKIELFDKENYQSYAATAPGWMKNIIQEYNGNPYERLIGLAKLAQKSGVIKGILLHQGESNNGDTAWPGKVKTVYDNLLKDLNLDAGSVPLLAGELVNADQGGACANMNKIIATLPEVIANAHVISSQRCTAAPDHLHFAADGYRTLGMRYAKTMLSLLGYNNMGNDR